MLELHIRTTNLAVGNQGNFDIETSDAAATDKGGMLSFGKIAPIQILRLGQSQGEVATAQMIAVIYNLLRRTLLVFLQKNENRYSRQRRHRDDGAGDNIDVRGANTATLNPANVSIMSTDSFAIDKGGSIDWAGYTGSTVATFGGIKAGKTNTTDGDYSGI